MRPTLRYSPAPKRLTALLRVLVGVSSTRLSLLPLGLAALALTATGLGCASHPADPNLSYQAHTLNPTTTPPPANARSLAFDAPVTRYAPQGLATILDRDNRAPEAIVGYESTVSYTYTRFDDRQYYDGSGSSSGSGGRYRSGYGSYVDRQSVTQTYTVRER